MLKRNYLALLGVLVSISIVACGHKKPKSDVEAWLIDENEVTLYRKLDGDLEQVIPIPKNKDVSKFMCFSMESLQSYLEECGEGK